MTEYVPNYYKKFKCIADRCRHSCCIGWEIDIDKETLSNYERVQGNFGEKLKNNISLAETPHFVLSADERCPFLNSNGLCDIYIALGEENLCEICKEHPRFHNFYASRTETGLGLCCEEAARLILSQKECFRLEMLEGNTSNCNDGEFFAKRKKIFDIICDRSLLFSHRIAKLREEYNINLPSKSFDEWIEIYLSLEILDCEWEKMLVSIKNKKAENLMDSYPYECENLLNYFVFRHLREEDIKNRLAFCIHCVEMIFEIFSRCENRTFEKLYDISRMFSAEIEYSEDNTDELLFIMNNF